MPEATTKPTQVWQSNFCDSKNRIHLPWQTRQHDIVKARDCRHLVDRQRSRYHTIYWPPTPPQP